MARVAFLPAIFHFRRKENKRREDGSGRSVGGRGGFPLQLCQQGKRKEGEEG